MKPAKLSNKILAGESSVKESEKPIRVIAHKGGHKTESRIFMRERWYTYCSQPGCKFYGKQAQQGVCYSADPEVMSRWDRMDKYIDEGVSLVKELRSMAGRNTKKYIQALEGRVTVYWANEQSGLDGLIWSRRKIALLEHEVERLKKKLGGKK